MYVDDRGERSRELDAGESDNGHLAYRDANGFLHVEMFAGYLWDHGRLLARGERELDRTLFRLVVPARQYRWCFKHTRRCLRPMGAIEFVTPWSNVASIRTIAELAP